jgi:phage portal protein BeeE
LSAAYDIVRGRVPKGMAVTSPFFYGVMNYGGTSGNVTAQRSRMTVERLRRFSETSIPRRFVNYYRNQLAMLDWWIVPKDSTQPFNQQQAKRVRQISNLLDRPNADMNWNTFVEQIIEEMCVVGVAPVEVKALRQREISDINDSVADAAKHMMYPFDGSSLQYATDWDGSPSTPRYAQALPNGDVVYFTNSELIPLRYTSRTSTPHGLSPMDVAYQDIEQFLEAGTFAGRTASNANPKKALQIKNMDEP